MDRFLKDELGLSKAMKLGMTAIVAVIVLFSLFLGKSLYKTADDTVKNQAIKSITNISQLNKDAIKRELQNRQLLQQTIAQRIEKRGIDNIEEILQEMDDFDDVYDCYRMGVLDESHILYRTDGSASDVRNNEITELIWDDQPHICRSHFPADNNEYTVNLFSYPIIYDGNVKYVLCASYFSKDLTARMNINSLSGKGYTFLLDSDSEVVIFPYHYEDAQYTRLMRYLNDTPEIKPDRDGNCYFSYAGDSYYAHFEMLGINDWYLLTCAKEKDVFEETNIIMHNFMLNVGLLWMITLGAIVFIVYYVYKSRRKLKKTIYYDKLLNIGNENALEVVFSKLEPQLLETMYLSVIDVDKLKEFNYIYGDKGSDNLLKYIAKVFRYELPEGYLFRYKMDHFIVLVSVKNQAELERKIQRVQDRFLKDIEEGKIQPFDTSSGLRKLDLQIPISHQVNDAMIALEKIKGNHLLQHAYYDEEFIHKRMRYMEMESALLQALKNNEFHAFYQPKYDMLTGAIIGAEALVRWIKADGTIISPGEFIPCFETSRQIILLDEAMLKQVCMDMKNMQSEGIDVKPVSVNLSRVHLRYSEILPNIMAIIKESNIDPSKLSFEITESALLEESIPLRSIIDELHALGCRVDMDDYGIGASGPKSLASNCFDVVKLDKSFVDDIGDGKVEDVIEATIDLAKKWGMEILAEGIEEKYQVEKLVQLGCVKAQGFYYSRPLPMKEYKELLRKSQSNMMS